jgi:hypothetical protein
MQTGQDYGPETASAPPAFDLASDRASSIVGIQSDALGLLGQLDAMLFGDQPTNPIGSAEKAAQPSGKISQLMAHIDAGQNQAQTIRDLIQSLINRL